MKFFLNGIEFHIESFPSGFAWRSWKGNHCIDESDEGYSTVCAAQQSAIDHVTAQMEAMDDAKRQRLEEKVYGTAEEQQAALYKSVIL